MRGEMKTLAVACMASLLVACSSQQGFVDLDRFVKEVDAKPRGKIEPLPEVEVYNAFTYGAANMRSPFVPPIEVVISEVKIEEESNIKPNEDRPKKF